MADNGAFCGFAVGVVWAAGAQRRRRTLARWPPVQTAPSSRRFRNSRFREETARNADRSISPTSPRRPPPRRREPDGNWSGRPAFLLFRHEPGPGAARNWPTCRCWHRRLLQRGTGMRQLRFPADDESLASPRVLRAAACRGHRRHPGVSCVPRVSLRRAAKADSAVSQSALSFMRGRRPPVPATVVRRRQQAGRPPSGFPGRFGVRRDRFRRPAAQTSRACSMSRRSLSPIHCPGRSETP